MLTSFALLFFANRNRFYLVQISLQFDFFPPFLFEVSVFLLHSSWVAVLIAFLQNGSHALSYKLDLLYFRRWRQPILFPDNNHIFFYMLLHFLLSVFLH